MEKSNFCGACGAALAPIEVEKRESPSRRALSFPPVEAAISVAKKIDKFRKRWSFKTSIHRLASEWKSRPIRFTAAVIGCLYAAAALTSFFWSSPKTFVADYVHAIATKNPAALANESFFPRSEGAEVADPLILAGLETKAGDFVVELDWSIFSTNVTATVVWADGKEVDIPVSAKAGFFAGILVRDWKIDAEASTLTLASGPSSIEGQAITVGGKTFSDFTDRGLKELLDRKFIVFPGEFSLKMGSQGLAAAEIQDVEIPLNGVEVKLSLEPTYGQPPAIASALAETEATSAVNKCIKTKCSSLPYFLDSDFTWDDSMRDYETFFDDYQVSTSYIAGTCEVSGFQATDETAGTVFVRCPISALRQETYIDYYYFLSDDYSFYWGNAEKTMTYEVRIKFDSTTKEFKATKVFGRG